MKTNKILYLLLAFKENQSQDNLQKLRFTIYEVYFELLLAFARKYFDEITAEQVLFDFFERRMIAKYLLHYPNQDRSSFDKYLFASFRNFCFSSNKRLKHKKSLVDDYSDQIVKESKTVFFEDNIHLVVKNYLGPLKLEHKTVILLRAANFSFKEIGTIMGITEKAAKSKMYRARENVRDHLSSNRPFKYKDLARMQELLSTIQEPDIKCFLKTLAYSNKKLGEIFEAIEEKGVDTNKLIQRSIVYIKKYYHRAA